MLRASYEEERHMMDASDRTESITAEQAKQATAKERAARTPGPARVARTYFFAVAERDLDAMVACWAPGGVDNIAPIGPLSVPDEMREFFSELFAAVPDMRFEVIDVVAARNQAAVRWHSSGTFCGGPFQGVEPTGARIDLEGIDLLTVEGGLIQRNDAYYDGTQFARQIGMLPPRDSTTERGMTNAFNARTRLTRSLFKPNVVNVADGVWLVQGGFPLKVMNVYLIRDGDGVLCFDAGIRAMTRQIGPVAAGLGGITRIVLGHGHADHRGAAPGLAAPVFCHPDEVADAEGDGGAHYFDFSRLERWFARVGMPLLLKSWDGGPVKIEGTVAGGDEIAGFEVMHLPGHAPGLIGLWRGADRLALVSDTLYTLDPQTGRKGEARLPHAAFNKDTEQARASIRKLAALDPRAVWAGHADPLTGSDVRSELERAAEG
jgi:glyoxylase-like metal-dependent hydrolase (beta-lactamase superfamily II)/predicted ester cyclase